MKHLLKFRVDGEPVAKARARKGLYGWYTPQKTVDYENRVSGVALQAIKGWTPFKGPLKVTINICRSFPKSMSMKKKLTALPVTKPDIDNYIKIILDAMNTIVYVDDNQIIELSVAKMYGIDPHIGVAVEELVDELQ